MQVQFKLKELFLYKNGITSVILRSGEHSSDAMLNQNAYAFDVKTCGKNGCNKSVSRE